MNQEKN